MLQCKSLYAAAACVAVWVVPVASWAEPVQLKFAFPSPATSWVNTEGIAPWSRKVEEAAGGEIEIKLYPGGSIGNFRTVYDRLINGVAELAFGTFGSIEDQFRKSSVAGLPFLSDRSSEAGLALWRLYARGVTVEEFAPVKPLAMFGFGATGLHMTKPILKAEDLKGVKVLANGRSAAKLVTLVGAVPITSTPAELYQGLSRGIAEGISFSWSGLNAFKLSEVTKHHLALPFGTTGGYFFMNKQAFERLPEKSRQAIDRFSGEAFVRAMVIAADTEDEESRAKVLAGPGHVVHELAPQEVERLKGMLVPMTEEWVANTPDGAKVLAAFREEIARIRQAR